MTEAAPSIYKSPAGQQAVAALYDRLLASWPVPSTHLTVPTRHGDTFVVASGEPSAPPLVLLHGAGTNAAMWAADAVEYCRRYRVFAVDLIGEPGKSAPNRPSWEGPAYAQWLADVLDGLQIDRASFVGLSQGAWCALKLAVADPSRVERLALMSPGGIVPDKLSFLFRVLPLMLLGRWGSRRVNRIVLGGQAVAPEVEEVLTVLTTHFRPRVGTLPIFTDAELAQLTMPVLLLIGARDALRDAAKITARMQSLMPQLTATIVPDGGHALLNTAPRILAFLGEPAGGR